MRGFCKRWTQLICAAALALSTLNAVAAEPFLPLYANINSKTVGAPIGIGGAALGEPTTLGNLTTVVTQAAPGRRFVRVSNDLSSTTARRLRWQLLDNVNVTQGVLTWSIDFTPTARDSYSILVREATTSASSFVTLSFTGAGSFGASDQNGVITVAPLTYAANARLHVVLRMDLDAATSDVLINGEVLYAGRAHGVVGVGVGSLWIGYAANSGGNAFALDNVQAIHEQRHPVVLDADLEDRPLNMPIGVGGAALGEPILADVGLATEVVSDGAGGRVLKYASTDTATARGLTWQWLSNIEARTGQVVVGLDVRFPQRDQYIFALRESGSNAHDFLSLRTQDDGGLRVFDNNGNLLAQEASYVGGRTYRLRMAFDMDSGTYDVLFDDVVLVAARAHGITNGRGIGRLLTMVSNGAAINMSVNIDNLQVEVSDALELLSPVFRNGFE